MKKLEMDLNFEGIDRNYAVVYKKGEEPSDVLFWLTRSPSERIKALELIRHEYNVWKYGTEQGFREFVGLLNEKGVVMTDVQMLQAA